MYKINRYLFFALGLFPILDFGILNVILALFLVTAPFVEMAFTLPSKRKVIFIIVLILLTTIPFISGDFQCSINFWLKKILPLYVTSVLLIFVSPYIYKKDYEKFKIIYIISVLFYVFRFFIIVLIEAKEGKLDAISEKGFLFYADVMSLLRDEVDLLDSFYHKPYFSLIIFLALLFTTDNFLKNKNKTLNLSLVLFFLASIIFPMSLPNIVIVFAFILYLIFSLFKQREYFLPSILLIGVIGTTTLFFYQSFKHKNVDITEDISFIIDHINGANNLSKSNHSNPRDIIYSALLNNAEDVPFFGYGYCEGKHLVTSIVEQSIYNNTSNELRNNILVNTDLMNSHLWQKSGVKTVATDSALVIIPSFNDCKSHIFYQTINNLSVDDFYTLSVSVKPINANLVLRLGELNNQMIILDGCSRKLSYIGNDITSYDIKKENDGFYRVGITTKIKTPTNLALIGFSGKNNKYNHCFEDAILYLKESQLEKGTKQSAYKTGFTKNEKNILGANINAHNVFLQEYYTGGIIGLIVVICYYSWLLYLGKVRGSKLISIFILALVFNSLFENIQYRQMGISMIIISSIILIFKKKE